MKRNFTGKALLAAIFALVVSGCTDTGSITTTPDNSSATTQPAGSTTFTTSALTVISQKCTVCHSQNPTLVSGGPAGGISFDTTAQIISRASQIRREVMSGQMPERPVTLTTEERSLIGQWAAQQ
jgi:uncharacterized membrane protein